MASHIDRREFMATVSGVAVAWPLAAHAQTDFPNLVYPYGRALSDGWDR